MMPQAGSVPAERLLDIMHQEIQTLSERDRNTEDKFADMCERFRKKTELTDLQIRNLRTTLQLQSAALHQLGVEVQDLQQASQDLRQASQDLQQATQSQAATIHQLGVEIHQDLQQATQSQAAEIQALREE